MVKTLIFIVTALIVAAVFSMNLANNDKAKPHKETRDFEFSYKVKIPSLPEDSKTVDVFVPLPKNDNTQRISDLKIISNVNYSIEKDPEYHNKILHVNLDKKLPSSLDIQVNFHVERKLDSENSYSKDTRLLNRFLMPDSLVPIKGIVKKEAKEVVKTDNISEFDKAKLLYNHVVDTMVYDKKSTTGWGRGDVLYACDARTGNCTDFHSLFIGLSRAEKIPSRFVIGFPIPENKKEGKIPGYHCWAEFYTNDKGWVPIDASEAFKHPDRRKFYFGALDPNRVAFTIGRDIPLKTGDGKIKKVNYLVYPYVFVNDKKYDNVKAEFYFKDIE